MQIIEWPQFLEDTSPLKGKSFAVTVGIFDGVHLGHRALIEAVVSQKERTVPVVITFRQGRYKKAVGVEKHYPGDILSFRQKMAIFESLGVAITIVVEFSESFRKMSGKEFLRILCEHGNMVFMAVGSNFRCGYRLDTDALAIQDFNSQRNIQTQIVQPLTEDGKTISSSQIRSAITCGKLREAAAMLGRPFTVDLFETDIHANDDLTAGDYLAYEVAGQGRLLPPPGRYEVLLLDKDCDHSAGTPAEIRVEKGSILISEEDADAGIFHEYVEFLC
ncbi:MAG: FAD synthetase family protein [Treponema sp.]|jgi:riboflavin kinase/FMN adenylyltransferase|nr:FAD synthetase family protein [Treponema sp.]